MRFKAGAHFTPIESSEDRGEKSRIQGVDWGGPGGIPIGEFARPEINALPSRNALFFSKDSGRTAFHFYPCPLPFDFLLRLRRTALLEGLHSTEGNERLKGLVQRLAG
jgi:hypothetical protein